MTINTATPNEIGIFQTMIASGPVIVQTRDGVEKTLLVKHGDKPISELKWKFCGGKIIAGHSLEATAIREAKEEIGVEVRLIRPLKPIILWDEMPETGTNNPLAVILIHYLAEIIEEPVKGAEILAMEWFNINDLPPDCSPNVFEIMEELKKN